jgi:anthranilate synthase component 1
MHQPSREEFKKLAERGNLIPVYREILADLETPVAALKKILEYAGSREGIRHSFLLESVEGGERIARYSFLGTNPSCVVTARGREVTVRRNGHLERHRLEHDEDPLHVIAGILAGYRWVPDRALPPFAGGAVGYLSYDCVRFFERLPETTQDDLALPDACFIITDTLVIFDHLKHRIKIVANAHVEGDPDAAYDDAVARVDQMARLLARPFVELLPLASGPEGRRELSVMSNMQRSEFCDMVATAKEYIAAGDVIQVVLSQRFSTPMGCNPIEIYRALRSLNPSPYMYYLQMDDLTIVGSSPEILVTKKEDRVAVRPIAGTRPRGATDAEDLALEKDLLADEKERAEHVMLVDLGRNDIGRVCEHGSVRVDEQMVIERYSHVMHIVSNVVGKLRSECDQFDVIRATFPAGTVSGAPKVRAMEIIDEMEPTRRGPYAGCIGYFGFSGNMDMCITIRTMLVKDGTAYVQAGAGIVADSIPEREYEETKNKALALMRAIQHAEHGLQ